MSQDKISCKRKKLPVTGRYFLLQGEISFLNKRYTNQQNIGPTGGNGNDCFSEEQVGTSAYYAYAYNGTVGSLVTPNSGSWSGFAGTNATNIWYFFDVALTGGVSYTAGIYARASVALSTVTEGSVAISYGASASATDMTTQIVAPSVLGTSYQQTTGEFTPTSDGTYTIGVNVVHDGAFGGYLNFDDICNYYKVLISSVLN